MALCGGSPKKIIITVALKNIVGLICSAIDVCKHKYFRLIWWCWIQLIYVKFVLSYWCQQSAICSIRFSQLPTYLAGWQVDINSLTWLFICPLNLLVNIQSWICECHRPRISLRTFGKYTRINDRSKWIKEENIAENQWGKWRGRSDIIFLFIEKNTVRGMALYLTQTFLAPHRAAFYVFCELLQ